MFVKKQTNALIFSSLFIYSAAPMFRHVCVIVISTSRFACNSAGTEELPDDDKHVSKHVEAAE
jgi:hypothetical protein